MLNSQTDSSTAGWADPGALWMPPGEKIRFCIPFYFYFYHKALFWRKFAIDGKSKKSDKFRLCILHLQARRTPEQAGGPDRAERRAPRLLGDARSSPEHPYLECRKCCAITLYCTYPAILRTRMLLTAPDNGKPYVMSVMADVALTVKCYRYFAGWADKVWFGNRD